MYPVINLGPFVIPTAGLVYILGAWVCLSLIERSAQWLNLDVEKSYGLALVGLVSSVVGARITFVALYWSAFQENLLGIIWPLNSGYNLWGGLFFGVASLFFYGRYRQLPFLPTMDAFIPGVVTGFIFISLADFLAGPGFGTYTRLPWAINQFSADRHPVQIYEILAGGLALFAWWQLVRYRVFAGQLLWLTTAVYSGGRLFIDAFRQNAALTSNGYHIVQIISLVILIISLYQLGIGHPQHAEQADPLLPDIQE